MLVARGTLLFSLLALISLPANGWQQPSLEYDVKAAFVLNFVRYTEWPAQIRTPPLRMCVLQINPFGARLHNVVTGELWRGTPIEVGVIPDMSRARECHLLYVAADASEMFAKNISALSGAPVLTVGEDQLFLERGGIIRLFVEDNRIRFTINQKTADAVGIILSSRLLRLARSVIGTGS